MRDDLDKQICEQERRHSGLKFRYVRHKKKHKSSLRDDPDGENQRSHEGIKFRYRDGPQKSFSDHLSPLFGAVRKAVGSRWDRFYSELCQKFDMDKYLNQHVLDHLADFCELDLIVTKEGELYVRRHFASVYEPLRDAHRVEFYVDPRNGIIRKNKWHKSHRQVAREDDAKAKKKYAAVFRQIDNKNVLHLIDDVWYHYTLEKIPRGKEIIVPRPGVEFYQDFRNQRKIWDKLRDFDKERLGLRKFEGKRVKDVMTEKSLYHDGTKVCEYNNRFYHHNLSTMYHATKKTASHKILKKAGLVK